MELSDHLDKLKAFIVIVDAGRLHEAARRLHVTQPALTRMVKILEDACGAELLVRTRQGVTLTTAGQELYQYAKSVLKELANVQMKIQAPSKKAGHLVIGTYESLAEYLWPDFLKHLQKENPDLAISLKTSSEVKPLELLARGELDLVVDAEPRINEEFISWPVYKDKFNFFTASGMVTELDQESAKDQTLIFVPQAMDEEDRNILYYLESRGYYFSKKLTLDSFTTAQTFCSRGLGIAVLPMRLQAAQGRHNQTQSLKLKDFPSRGFGEHSICATIRASQKDHPQISDFIKKLKTWFKV